MSSHLARTPHSRRAFAAACIPYLLASIFVEFLHVDPQVRAGVPTFVVGQASVGVSEPSRPTDACPACLWLRIGVRLDSRVLSADPTRVVSAEVETLADDWSDSPVQLLTTLRGPPTPVLQ